MDNIQFGDIDFSATNRSKKKNCSKCKSAEHTIVSCPLNPCGHCKILGHISASCPIKKQESQARKRVRNMSSEQIERQRENDLAENMSPEQVEQQRERHLVENMKFYHLSNQLNQHWQLI